jgi:hypothetical protein
MCAVCVSRSAIILSVSQMLYSWIFIDFLYFQAFVKEAAEQRLTSQVPCAFDW